MLLFTLFVDSSKSSSVGPADHFALKGLSLSSLLKLISSMTTIAAKPPNPFAKRRHLPHSEAVDPSSSRLTGELIQPRKSMSTYWDPP
jgi:hypothetical protein